MSSPSSWSLWGTTPIRARILRPSTAGSRPKIRNSPSVTRRNAADHPIVDDFPAPVGPRNPNDSTARPVTSMPSTAVKSPKRLTSLRAEMRGSDMRWSTLSVGSCPMPVRLLTPTDLDTVLAINQSGVPGVGTIEAAQLAHLVGHWRRRLALVATIDAQARPTTSRARSSPASASSSAPVPATAVSTTAGSPSATTTSPTSTGSRSRPSSRVAVSAGRCTTRSSGAPTPLVPARGQSTAAQRRLAGVPRPPRLRRGRPAGDRLRLPRQPDGQTPPLTLPSREVSAS